MLILTYYAIRHRPSRAFMPAKMFRTVSGGFTWWEPGKEGYEGHSKLPRFFPDRHAAAVALTVWLKGPHVKSTYTERESWEMPEEYTVQDGVKPLISETPRNREDMEIVRFDLKETL